MIFAISATIFNGLEVLNGEYLLKDLRFDKVFHVAGWAMLERRQTRIS